MQGPIDVDSFLGSLSGNVKAELASTPEVVDAKEGFTVGDLYLTARRWVKIKDVVSVVADLKSSTKLGTGKWKASTASIYEASTGNVVSILNKFDSDFIQIQGDGVFGLFWGELRYERALCAGITIKTFSVDLVEQLTNKWKGLPDTGYKVGVGNSPILAKKVGTPRNPAQQEPVWAGKSLNYATKCAQSADRHEMIVTGSVWDRIERNDYLAFSCPCNGGPGIELWKDVKVDKLPEGEPDAEGRKLASTWCALHGGDYCEKIMAGSKKRDDVAHLRYGLELSQMRDPIRKRARIARESRSKERGIL